MSKTKHRGTITMKSSTKNLIRTLQQQQDDEFSRRSARVCRGIKSVGFRFFNEELKVLEEITERAFGRMKLGKIPYPSSER